MGKSHYFLSSYRNGENFNSLTQNSILQTPSMASSTISKIAVSFTVQYHHESENACATAASQSLEWLNFSEVLYENGKKGSVLCWEVVQVLNVESNFSRISPKRVNESQIYSLANGHIHLRM
jgi:hypothetical protein